MSINKSEPIMRSFFHLIIKPVIAFLPDRRRNQFMTIAHHIKMTFFHGHVMQFGKTVVVAQKSAALPAWVVNEMKDLAEIEPELLPTPEYLSQFHAYRNLLDDRPGRVFAACHRIIADTKPDIIFLAPWMKRGGADLGVLHHIDFVIKKGMKAVLITALNVDSPWIGQVPKEVPVVELGKLGSDLTEEERVLVQVRLILQSTTKIIHIINSPLGWEMLKNHGKSLQAMGIAIFASLYCDDFDVAGRNQSYGRRYLSTTLQFLTGIICDTIYYPKELVRCYGTDIHRTYTVYFPNKHVDAPKYISSDKGSILWAGRISHQKRPDILLKIALAMPGFHFHVKGYAESENEKNIEKQLKYLPNVTLTGAYSSLLEEGKFYSLFLYTSAWDGLPNVLLEATVAGLPIVASSVGGVPEFINEETGYLIGKLEAIDDYVTAIRRAIGNPEERHGRWKNAIELVQTRHSFEAFAKRLENIDGYFCVHTDASS